MALGLGAPTSSFGRNTPSGGGGVSTPNIPITGSAGSPQPLAPQQASVAGGGGFQRMLAPLLNYNSPVNSDINQRVQAMADQTYNTLSGSAAPDRQAIQDYQARQYRQIDLASGLFESLAGQLHNQAGIDQAGIGLQRNKLGLENTSIDRQLMHLENQKDTQRRLQGLTESSLTSNLASQTRRATDDAVARGAAGSPGLRGDVLDARGESQRGVIKSQVDLRDSLLKIGEQQSGLTDKRKGLAIAAKQLGLDEATLQNRLQQGLSKLGVDRMTTIEGLFDKLHGSKRDERALVADLIAQAYQITASTPTDRLPKMIIGKQRLNQ